MGSWYIRDDIFGTKYDQELIEPITFEEIVLVNITKILLPATKSENLGVSWPQGSMQVEPWLWSDELKMIMDKSWNIWPKSNHVFVCKPMVDLVV